MARQASGFVQQTFRNRRTPTAFLVCQVDHVVTTSLQDLDGGSADLRVVVLHEGVMEEDNLFMFNTILRVLRGAVMIGGTGFESS